MTEYSLAFEQGGTILGRLESDPPHYHQRLLNGLDVVLMNLEDVVTGMEAIPEHRWGFSYSNIAHWELLLLRPGVALDCNSLVRRIRALAGRLDQLDGIDAVPEPDVEVDCPEVVSVPISTVIKFFC